VGFSLVSAAQLAVHLVEVVLVVVLPRDALLFVLVRGPGGGLVVLLVPRDNRELVRARPECIVGQSLVAVDARAVRDDGAISELLDTEPLRAEAPLLVDESTVGLLDVVLEVGPREAECPVEPVESEEARVGAIWVREVPLEALAVNAEVVAELAELVGLFAVHNRVDSGLAEQALGVDGAVRHLVLNNRVILLFEGTISLRGPLYQFYYEIECLYTKEACGQRRARASGGPLDLFCPIQIHNKIECR